MSDVTKSLNIYVSSGQAEAAMETLTARSKKLEAEIAAITTRGKDASAKIAELGRNNEAIDRLNRKIKGELNPSMRDLERTAVRLKAELKQMSEQDAGFEKKRQQYQAARQALEQYGQSLNRVNTQIRSTQSSGGGGLMSSLGSAAATLGIGFGAGMAISEVKTQLTGAFEEAKKAETGIHSLSLALENAGKIESLSDLTKQADDLQKSLGVFDNDDIIKAQTKLVTYGKISVAQIQQLIPVIADFASFTEQDIDSATEAVIQGLNGQGRSLKQYGVILQQNGTVADNFGAIMTQLGTKVKGASESFGSTGAGSIQKFNVAWANLQETIGDKLLPVISKAMPYFSKLIDIIPAFLNQWLKIRVPLMNIADHLTKMFSLIGLNVNGIDLLTKSVNAIGSVLGFVLRTTMLAVELPLRVISGLQGLVLGFFTSLKALLLTLKDYGLDFGKVIDAIKDSFTKIKGIVAGSDGVFSKLKQGFEIAILPAKTIYAVIKDIADKLLVMTNMKDKITDFFDTFKKHRDALTSSDNGAIEIAKRNTDRRPGTGTEVDPEALDKAKKAYEDLLAKFRQFTHDMQMLSLDAENKEIEIAREKYAKLMAELDEFHRKHLLSESQFAEYRKEIEKALNDDLLDITDKYYEQRSDKEYKATQDITAKMVADAKAKIKQGFLDGTLDLEQFNAAIEKLNEAQLNQQLQNAQDYMDSSAAAQQDYVKLLDDLTDKQIELKKKLLNSPDAPPGTNSFSTPDNSPEAKYALFQQMLSQMGDQISYWGNLVGNLYGSLMDMSNAFAEQELANIDRIYNERKSKLEAQRSGDTITEENYNARVLELEKQRADEIAKVKRKQFEAEKIGRIGEAGMNTAVAITKALAELGPIAGPIAAALIGATGAIQIAAITATQPPQFYKGTENAPPGWKWVGEQGPELIWTPGGDKIKTNRESQSMAAAYSKSYSVNASRGLDNIGYAKGNYSRMMMPAFSESNSSQAAGAGIDNVLRLIHAELIKSNGKELKITYTDLKRITQNVDFLLNHNS